MLSGELSVMLRNDRRPLYVQAEEALMKLLNADYRAGDRLPPEPQLALQLGISRSTLREAMRSFEERGLISRRQGVGTFVTAPSNGAVIESGLESLESVDALARRKGLDVADRDVEITETPADELVACRLRLAPGAPVVKVARTKIADGRPVAYIVDIVPASIVALDELRAGFHGSVLDFLQARGRPALSYAWAHIISTVAGAGLAARLQALPTTPLLLLEESLYSTDGAPVEFSQNYFISTFFQFHVVRRIGG
jgi:GntR family transcriptional regulator